MKENNLPFSIIDNVPFKRTIVYACSIGVNNSHTSVALTLLLVLIVMVFIIPLQIT